MSDSHLSTHKPWCQRAGQPAYIVDESTGCWEWQLSKDHHGYGRFALHGKKIRAIRAYYENFNGPIPVGMEIHHHCGNTSCVNPDHLEAVSHADNVRLGRQTRMTKQQADDIRALHQLGYSYTALAKKFGFGRTHITNIVLLKSWA